MERPTMAERLKITIKNLRLEIEGPAGPVVDTLTEFLASLRPKSDNLSLLTPDDFVPEVRDRFNREHFRPNAERDTGKSGSFRMFG
jgi:hypothetical protein